MSTPAHPAHPAPGLRHMVAAAISFSLMSLLVRLAGAEGIPTMQVVFARSIVVLAITGLLLLGQGVSPLGRSRRLLILRGVVGFISLSCFYYALIHLPLADATVIQYTNPVWTALLAAVLIREAIGRRELALSLASLAGVVIIARPAIVFGTATESLPALPVLVGLIGAFVSGLAYVIVRHVSRTEMPLVIVFWFSLVSAAGSLPMLVGGFVSPSPATAWLLLGVGVTTFLGQIFVTLGLRAERAGKAMSMAYLQVVFAALWGALILAEQPDRWTLVGAVVILGSTWLLGRVRAPGAMM